MKITERKNKYCVYIAQCSLGTYYTGSTNDLEKRVKLHDSGRGAKYLRGKGPVKVVYVRKYGCRKSALNAERNIKDLTRKQKEEMVRDYASLVKE